MQAILRHINFDVVKCILIASPGFVRDQFYEYMFQEAIKTDNKVLIENKSKFLLVHSSSGFKHSLKGIKFWLDNILFFYYSQILEMYLFYFRSTIRTCCYC
jgi:hypothetical protein